ncbi:MAG: hypothetical protein RBT41_00145 [Clostridia bacterium]|nr:hypothetical protein [Clostridia bacterium]
MEDILGVIIFIVFIALRAMSDRKKGMKKEPDQKNAQQPEPGRTTTRPLAPPRAQKPVRPAAAPVKKAPEKAMPARKAPEPVGASGGKKPTPSLQPATLGEGMSMYDRQPRYEGLSDYDRLHPLEGVSEYDSLPIMEGADPCHAPAEIGPVLMIDMPEPEALPLFAGQEDLRRAVIWSEILQKPRFKNKYPGYRKIS